MRSVPFHGNDPQLYEWGGVWVLIWCGVCLWVWGVCARAEHFNSYNVIKHRTLSRKLSHIIGSVSEKMKSGVYTLYKKL